MIALIRYFELMQSYTRLWAIQMTAPYWSSGHVTDIVNLMSVWQRPDIDKELE